jgi:hypothetical protein
MDLQGTQQGAGEVMIPGLAAGDGQETRRARPRRYQSLHKQPTVQAKPASKVVKSAPSSN